MERSGPFRRWIRAAPSSAAAREARMSKRTWMRSSSPAVWAAALVLGVPALVQAQTQLFPLAPIQRQRPPCPMEDPIYGMYRQQYFGYFPTCWRTFPPGWGCPSTEAPNMARAFAERKRDPFPETLPDLDSGPGMGPGPGEGSAQPRGRGTPPPLPPPRSPFDLPDAGANPNPGANRTPAPGRSVGGVVRRDPRANPPSLPPATNRIEPPQRVPDVKRDPTEGTVPLLALPAPVEPAPSPIPVGTGADPVGQNGPIPMPLGAPGASLGPLPAPAMPDPGAGAAADAGASPTVMNPSPLPPPATETPATTTTGFPVQAPQRRGPISSLFNGMASWLHAGKGRAVDWLPAGERVKHTPTTPAWAGGWCVPRPDPPEAPGRRIVPMLSTEGLKRIVRHGTII